MRSIIKKKKGMYVGVVSGICRDSNLLCKCIFSQPSLILLSRESDSNKNTKWNKIGI